LSERPDLEPLYHRSLHDYHCHCDFSIDAVGTIDEYCQAALQRGLTELCFTTHFDTNPEARRDINIIRIGGEDKPATADNLAPYVEAVQAAHDQYYAMGLQVKLGVEIGYWPGCEEMVAKLRERYGFDHVLCGIHELEGLCFCCRHEYETCFARYDLEKMLSVYYSYATQAAGSGVFDAIAHLDYYRKFGEKYYGDAIKEKNEQFFSDLFAALNKTGTALEINTSGIRRGLSDYFPTVPVLTQAKRAGVEVAYLGSDAHRPEHVGYDFDAAVHLLSRSLTVCEID